MKYVTLQSLVDVVMSASHALRGKPRESPLKRHSHAERGNENHPSLKGY